MKQRWERLKKKFYSNKQYIESLKKEGVRIGKGCEIYRDVNWGSEPYLIELGDYVRITNGVRFITHDGGLWTLRRNGLLKNGDRFGKIYIGDNTHIGINTVIMPGVRIGKSCIIGCGAIVTKDIPDQSVAVGVPARVIESLQEYYQKIQDKVVFTKGLSYEAKREFLISYYQEADAAIHKK